jgi:hypothetical protein
LTRGCRSGANSPKELQITQFSCHLLKQTIFSLAYKVSLQKIDMTKQVVFIAALLCSTFFTSGQPKSIHHILDRPWLVSDQHMSGVGDHQSLSEQTVLMLRPDFTWHTTEPIEGLKTGSWREAGKNKILLLFAKGIEAELVLQDDGKLRMTRTKGLTKTTIYWKIKP